VIGPGGGSLEALMKFSCVRYSKFRRGEIDFGTGKWWAVSDLNAGPSGCKPDALTAELTAQK
jgi:hypothetical protein